MIREPVPVSVRGQLFPSMTACAKRYNTKVGHVADMLDRGTLDNLGKGRNFDRKKPVWLDGQPFDSIADLARHIGASPESVAAWRRHAIGAGRDHLTVRQGRITWSPP